MGKNFGLSVGQRLLARLRSLGAVLGTSLLTVCNTLRIQRAADDVVTDTRKILNTTAANHYNRVLLQVVTDTRNVSGNFHTVGQLNTLRSAEFGFFGVMVLTVVQTPLFCGDD